MTNSMIVLTTCETPQDAARIAQALVEQQLAACVNVIPGIHSTYRWKGSVETSNELLLLIKTSAELFDKVRTAIEELHPYELPECIAVPIVAGSERYLGWLAAGLQQSGTRPR